MKNKNLIASALVITLTMISLVSAFGVSSPYWDDNPLIMERGETKVVNLNLQNMVGEDDVNVKAELLEGSDITSLSKDTFVVRARTSDTMVPLKITMPKEAVPGEIKKISVEFKTVSDKATGVAMGTGMSIYFNVIAGEGVKKDNTTLIVGIIIAIIVLVIIIKFLVKKRKK